MTIKDLVEKAYIITGSKGSRCMEIESRKTGKRVYVPVRFPRKIVLTDVRGGSLEFDSPIDLFAVMFPDVTADERCRMLHGYGLKTADYLGSLKAEIGLVD